MQFARLLVAVTALHATSIAMAADAAEELAPNPAGEVVSETIPVSEGPDQSATAAPVKEERQKSRMVEEIIVTAQKREEKLQDIPISIQAFSAEALDARGIIDQSGLQQVTPGLDIGSQVGYTTVFLRGVGTDAFLTADPSVAMYIDGIYYPFAQSLVQSFGAVERVEVLKGPQGTIFGRNATGGAISVVTKNPDFAAPETSVQLSYGRFDDFQSRVYTNVPLADNFAISVSALYNSADYYIKGTVAGEPLPKETSRGARVKVRWAPVEDLDATLSMFRLRISGVGSIFQPNANPSLLGTLVGIQAHDGYEGAVDTAAFTEVTNKVYYGNITYNAPGVDIKLIGSDQNMDAAGCYDFDGSQLPLAQFCPDHQVADIQTGELQFVSNADSWGSDWLQWIVGGYYFKGHQGFDPIHVTVAGLGENGTLHDLLNDLLPASLIDPVFALLGPTGQLSAVATTDTKSKAGFIQATAAITDWLSLTLGGRYQKETRSIGNSSTGVRLPNGETLPIPWHNAYDQNGKLIPPSYTTSTFRPKVSIELRPSDDGTLIYASYQEAVKSATYNTLGLYLPPSFVYPEEMKAYEVGIKGNAFNGATRYSAAAFWYDITNLQTQFISLLQGGAIAFENAKGARSRGVDFDTLTEVFPDTIENLIFTLGGAYIDAVYTDYPDGSGYREGNGLFDPSSDFTGNDISRSPRWTFTSSLSKTWFVGPGSFELAGDVYYNGGFYFAASNTSVSKQEAYTTYGARASYLYDPWQLRVTIFGRNLGNEKYAAGNLPTDFGNQYTLAPPRTYGVRLNWDF